jgi:hypothetical protein
MASQEIDRLADPSATDEERQDRKRQLLKGPRKFSQEPSPQPPQDKSMKSAPSYRVARSERVLTPQPGVKLRLERRELGTVSAPARYLRQALRGALP